MASATASGSAVVKVGPISFPLETQDPFLFAVYHKDMYPAGDEKMQAPRRGDGADFNPKAPYRMYHGDRVPGFPQHPHRGFETITATMEGTVDHTDSLGNAGRYSAYDMQFMTAGSGCVHGEMFPLVHADKPNTLRLFQLWLNLPRKDKMVDPGYVMSWGESMVKVEGSGGARALLYFGTWGAVKSAGVPTPKSWAADPANDVGVFFLEIPAGGSITLPPAAGGAAINRSVFVVEGPKAGMTAGGRALTGPCSLTVKPDAEVPLTNGGTDATEMMHVLVLQGRPIGEPVVQHGPFVGNSRADIEKAFADYRATGFGGWPWPQDAMVFPRTEGRFATYVTTGPDGKKMERVDRPPTAAAAAPAAGGATATAATAAAPDASAGSGTAAVAGGKAEL